MKRTVGIIFALVITLTLVIGFAVPASAATGVQNGDSLSLVQPGGGAYIHVTKLVPGDLEFNYGWDNSRTFAALPASMWIGVYDVTDSHYEWAPGWQTLAAPAPKLKLSQTLTTPLVSGHTYKIVFWTKDQSGNTVFILDNYYRWEEGTVVFTAP